MAIHWKRLLTLISLFLMAGCSSGNDIVGDIGTAIQAELLAQATSVADPPIAPTPTLQNDNETEVVALLEQADALEASGEFAAALALVDEAAILAPNSAKVHWMRGRFLYRLNDLQAALAAYDVAVQLGMDWPSGYLTLANLCATMGNTTTELAALNKTIDLSLAQGDGKADSVLMLALQYRSELWARAGDLPAAIADLEASLSIAPWEYGNFITLNELHHRLTARQAAFTEDPVALLADLNDRLGNHPADAQSLLDRGHLTLQLAFIDGDVSNLNSAYQDFTLALSIEPTLAEAYHGRGLVTWLASDDDADVSGMDVEEILALAEIVSTVNLQVADATVTISGGMVTMTNTHSGAVTVQSVDEWRVAHVKLPVMAGATQEAALADLDMALSLAPNLVAARHDRGVIRLRAWFNDGLISMLNEGPPDSPDEALAAAVSDLNFAAQQSPDWAVARFNRGVARLF